MPSVHAMCLAACLLAQEMAVQHEAAIAAAAAQHAQQMQQAKGQHAQDTDEASGAACSGHAMICSSA